MNTWKQPDLGRTIQQLRQTKKLTQEELVEKCNLNVRTLQRIESGDVTPRDFTIRAILTALNYDFEQIQFSLSRKTTMSRLQMAWVAGLCYFLLGIGETWVDFLRFDSELPGYFSLIYVTVKFASAATFAVFMLGYAEMGKENSNSLLKIGSYLMLGTLIVINLYDIISIFSSLNYEEFMGIKGLEAVVFGGVDIIFGIALLRIKSASLPIRVAGILEIVAGGFFLSFFLSFIGLFLLIPITILEVIILFQYRDKLQSRGQAPS